MIRGLKICGVSDLKPLNFILNHPHPPKFIGFISNYEKSRRFVRYEILKELINVDKKKVNFTSVLVNPTDEILEKIKLLDFDYYQLYDVSPDRTKEIKLKFQKKIITALTISNKDDVIKYKNTIIALSDYMTEQISNIRSFLSANMYQSKLILDHSNYTEEVIKGLFFFYKENLNKFSNLSILLISFFPFWSSNAPLRSIIKSLLFKLGISSI